MAYQRRESIDPAGLRVLDIREDFGATHHADIDIEADEVSVRRCRLKPDDPASAEVETETRWQLVRGGWRVGGLARTRVSGNAGGFIIETYLEANEGDARIFSRDFTTRVPRNFV
jgi:hypothetical protein